MALSKLLQEAGVGAILLEGGTDGLMLEPDTGQMIFPVDGWIMGTTLYPEGATHPQGSADISCQHWTKVVACRGGTVENIVQGSDGAWVVLLKHESDAGEFYRSIYGHWSEQPDLDIGQTIAAGEEIGYLGRTGIAVNPHVHFGIFHDATATIPLTLNKQHGDWVERGTFIPATFGAIANISEKADLMSMRTICDIDAYATPSRAGSLIGVIPMGTQLLREETSLGFYRCSWSGQDVWVPHSGIESQPMGGHNRVGQVGSHAFGDTPMGSSSWLIYRSGIVRRMRVVVDASPAHSRRNGPVLFRMPIGTFVTAFSRADDGWIDIMDDRLPNAILQGYSIHVWTPITNLVDCEEFEFSIAARNVPVYTAPSAASEIVHYFSVDASTRWKTTVAQTDPNVSLGTRYTTMIGLAIVNGFYAIPWPSAPGDADGDIAWVPGEMCGGRR